MERVGLITFALVSLTGCPADSVEGQEGDGSSEGSGAATVSGTTAPPATTQSADASTSADPTTGSDGSSSGSTTDEPLGPVGRCGDDPPPGAELPPPLPAYTGGACPPLVAGFNTLPSSGADREVLVVVPEGYDGSEVLPVVVLWHWLGGSANSFLEDGDVQTAVDQFRFLALIPEEKGDLPFRWPFTPLDSMARTEEEFVFFDDMLACAAESFQVDEACISTAGVSAGGLFLGQLASGRGERLASFMSLSGGTGGLVVAPWGGTSHAMPAFVLWGGPIDTCIAVNFENTSNDLEQNLVAGDHFILECIHNCGHGAPPFDVPMGMTAFAPLWRFVVDHPYWLEDGDSIYDLEGLPSDMPDWCSVGMGTATIREGACGPSQC